MTIHLRIWRQAGPDKPGRLVPYTVEHIIPDMSFLEMLDVVNEGLVARGENPIAFDHDCREGICGACGMMVNGERSGLLAHLEECERCRREVTFHRSTTRVAREMPPVKPSSRFTERVMVKIAPREQPAWLRWTLNNAGNIFGMMRFHVLPHKIRKAPGCNI